MLFRSLSIFQGATSFNNSLNISGLTTIQGASTYLSSLNISGLSIFQGASSFNNSLNISGLALFHSNVNIGTNNNPLSLLEINNSFYNGPLLTIDSGSSGLNSTSMPRAIGQPMLKIGKSAYSLTKIGRAHV